MRSLILNPKNWQAAWRFGICVLLICLVVYNPFAAVGTAPSNLSYAQMARNRATIGSSELQKFSPVPDPMVQPDFDVEARGAEPATAVRENQTGMVQREETPFQPELGASLWFRPPPTR